MPGNFQGPARRTDYVKNAAPEYERFAVKTIAATQLGSIGGGHGVLNPQVSVFTPIYRGPQLLDDARRWMEHQTSLEFCLALVEAHTS